MAIRVENVTEKEAKRHDFDVVETTGFLGMGTPNKYKIRILCKGQVLELNTDKALEIAEKALDNKKYWSAPKKLYQNKFTHKTVQSKYPNVDIYIKDFQFLKELEEQKAKEDEV